MGKRRWQSAAGDEEDNEEEGTIATRRHRRRRQNRVSGGDEEEEEVLVGESSAPATDEEKQEKGDDKEEEEPPPSELKAEPVGEVLKVSGKGRRKKMHYSSFEYDGNTFELEDPVLLTPEDLSKKPYVAIIKDITRDNKGDLVVVGQWFYRPEEAEKKGGGSWQTRDTRELFYSFHIDEVPAESVMHKCVVHFIPPNKQLPKRKEHPGFVVQKVYDTDERKLFKLTDKDYEESKQNELDVLMQKTRDRIGELPDIDNEDAVVDSMPENLKRNMRRRPINPLDVTKTDDRTARPDNFMKADTPGSSEVLKYHSLLEKFQALVGVSYRDRWLDKLIQGAGVVCSGDESTLTNDKAPTPDTSLGHSKTADAPQNDGISNVGGNYLPEVAVPILAALERVTFDTLGYDFGKYNQKMRQLMFNLKSNSVLAQRLLNKELDPSVLLSMTPYELKAGLTAKENATAEPEESKQIQMTDARCSRCTEQKVGIMEIIQAGGHCDRYQLECIKCGHNWYASRDSISALTIDAPTSGTSVGAVPLATAKFETVERILGPRDQPDPKAAADILEKSTAAFIPVLEKQKSFDKAKAEEPRGEQQ